MVRHSKYKVLLDEFMKKLDRGEFMPGGKFPSKDEIASQHNISPVTAYKIIRDLHCEGYITAHRGRRSMVNTQRSIRRAPLLAQPVGLFCPLFPAAKAYWHEWALFHIQRQLLADGNSSIWLTNPLDISNATQNYSGIISLSCVPQDDLYREWRETGVPYVAISFIAPEPNTVFVDYRNCIDQIFLDMLSQGVNRFLLMNESRELAQKSWNWHCVMGFRTVMELYGFSGSDFELLQVDLEQPGDILKLKEHLSTYSRNCHLGVLTPDPAYSAAVYQVLNDIGWCYKRDYAMTCYSSLPTSHPQGSFVDSKCEEMTAKILQQFYRRCHAGHTIPAEIVAPELIRQ